MRRGTQCQVGRLVLHLGSPVFFMRRERRARVSQTLKATFAQAACDRTYVPLYAVPGMAACSDRLQPTAVSAAQIEERLAALRDRLAVLQRRHSRRFVCPAQLLPQAGACISRAATADKHSFSVKHLKIVLSISANAIQFVSRGGVCSPSSACFRWLSAGWSPSQMSGARR